MSKKCSKNDQKNVPKNDQKSDEKMTQKMTKSVNFVSQTRFSKGVNIYQYGQSII